jgi:hypothetical protein
MTMEEYLSEISKECEGMLFVDISLSGGSCGYWFAHKDYYTVKNGKVYIIEGNQLTDSKDSLEDLYTQCLKVGKYFEGKTYKRSVREFRYKDLKKLLRL